jgi:hypothetical protein
MASAKFHEAAKRSAISRQAPAFFSEKMPPDFTPDNFEVDFAGCATEQGLTATGREQPGVTDALIHSA